MNVEWRNLSATRSGKQILSPCSGSLHPGRMVALMGASGSGKTTFLSCLRGDISHAGEVRFDGARASKDTRQFVGYAEQDDIVISQFTVRESLLFLAEMRFGIGAKEAVEKVDAVLAMMRLTNVQDTVVGEPGTSPRISGGERKRLCIGRELLREPKFLICDEPTSGLDSSMANQVVAAMRELCDTGEVALISSIHQPSTSILETFDDLILLREGVLLYYGPMKSAEALFAAHGPQRTATQSIAEYLMDCLVLPESDSRGMPADAITTLSKLAREQSNANSPWSSALVTSSEHHRFNVPFSRQIRLLARRHYKLQQGENFTKDNTVLNIGMMLISALLWLRLGFTAADVFPRFGLCMWTMGTWMFFPLFGELGCFSVDRRVLEKELKQDSYSLEAFYIARTLLVLPLTFVWPFVYVTGLFWITNANPDMGVYVQVVLLVFFNVAVFAGVGQAISATGMNAAHANTLSMLTITYFFGWSGFFMELSRLPAWLHWASHGNAFMYAVQIMMHALLTEDVRFSCDAPTTSKADTLCESTTDWLSSAEVKTLHGIDRSAPLCFGVLLGSLCFFRCLAYVLLRRSLRDAIHGVREVETVMERECPEHILPKDKICNTLMIIPPQCSDKTLDQEWESISI